MLTYRGKKYRGTIEASSAMTPETHPPSRARGRVATTDISGLPEDTEIFTLEGVLPVAHLLPGDRIVTRDGGMAVLRGLIRRHVCTRAVRFAAPGGAGAPPLVLPAAQPVLVRGQPGTTTLRRAGDLVNAGDVVDLGQRLLCLVEPHFDASHVIYAGGLEVAAPVMTPPRPARAA